MSAAALAAADIRRGGDKQAQAREEWRARASQERKQKKGVQGSGDHGRRRAKGVGFCERERGFSVFSPTAGWPRPYRSVPFTVCLVDRVTPLAPSSLLKTCVLFVGRITLSSARARGERSRWEAVRASDQKAVRAEGKAGGRKVQLGVPCGRALKAEPDRVTWDSRARREGTTQRKEREGGGAGGRRRTATQTPEALSRVSGSAGASSAVTRKTGLGPPLSMISQLGRN